MLFRSDSVWTGRLDPMAEGFGNFAGMIRTELVVQSGDQQGYVAFDVVYSPQVPATWTGAARDVVQDGSLDFILGANVTQPGRYFAQVRAGAIQRRDVLQRRDAALPRRIRQGRRAGAAAGQPVAAAAVRALSVVRIASNRRRPCRPFRFTCR